MRNLGRNAFLFLSFVLLWHFINLYSSISHQGDKINSFLRENSVDIEEMILKSNVIDLTNTLKTLTSSSVYKIASTFEKGNGDKINVTVGDISTKARLSRETHYPLIVNNYKIADIHVHEDLGKLNLLVFKENILFYVYLALFLIFFIYMVNYDLHDSITNLKSSLSTVLKKLEQQEGNIISGMDVDKNKEGLERDLYKVISTFVQELNTMKELEKEHELSKQVNELVLKFSHDMKSPISTLNTLLEHPDQLSANADLLKVVTERIKNISDDLLDKRRDIRVEKFNIIPVLQSMYAQKEKEFSLSSTGKLVLKDIQDFTIQANRGELERLLSNIINNGLEASLGQEGQQVIISSFSRSGMATITVEDNGPGISKENIPAILEGNFSNKDKGNGIGISSAKNYLNSIGGDLSIFSTLGEGTKIQIELPEHS